MFEGCIACKLVVEVTRLVAEHHSLEYLQQHNILQLVPVAVVLIVGECISNFVVEVTKNNLKLDEDFWDVVVVDGDDVVAVVVVVVGTIFVVVYAEVVAI